MDPIEEADSELVMSDLISVDEDRKILSGLNSELNQGTQVSSHLKYFISKELSMIPVGLNEGSNDFLSFVPDHQVEVVDL